MNSILNHIDANYTVTRTNQAVFFCYKDSFFCYIPEEKIIYATSEDGAEFYSEASPCKTVKSLVKFVDLRAN